MHADIGQKLYSFNQCPAMYYVIDNQISVSNAVISTINRQTIDYKRYCELNARSRLHSADFNLCKLAQANLWNAPTW